MVLPAALHWLVLMLSWPLQSVIFLELFELFYICYLFRSCLRNY